jgi:hypothetical protein
MATPDYTSVLNTISTSLQNIYTVLNNPTTNDGILQKLDTIILKLDNTMKLTAEAIPDPSTTTQIDYTSILNTVVERLNFMETAMLWCIGIGTASIVLYIIYRCLASFFEF